MSSSGVGTQARWLINGLINTGKYSFRCFGGAMRHDNYDTVVVNPDFIIKPTNGFGDKNLLRTTLAQVRPDALMLFTDPRFFTWVWEMEDEIHQICPITYWHLWDNPPWPDFNRPFYEATDLINCINYPTYEMVKERFPEKTNYIPHAVPGDLYAPLSRKESEDFKFKLLGKERSDHFVCLYVSRNARRKMTSDILVSWRDFIESLRAKHGHTKATLILHTDPMDPEGTNLFQVIDLLGIRDHVVFSKDRIGFNEMRSLYGVCDTIVNRSCFIAGTRVFTKNGFVPIEEVQVGDYVITHKKRWRQVTDLIRNSGKNKKIVTVKYSNGNAITCTDDHKIMAIKKSSLPDKFYFNESPKRALEFAQLTRVSELITGDYIVSMHEQLPQNSNIEINLFDYVKEKTYHQFPNRSDKETNVYSLVNNRILSKIYGFHDHGPEKISLTEEFAYILGNWAADGSTNSSSVSFDKKHSDKIKIYVDMIEKSLGMKCIISERKSHFDVTIQNGSVVSLVFKDLCGLYSGGKKIPDIIMNSTNAIKAAFIRGYLAGDGCELTHPQSGLVTKRIRTISSNSAAGIRELLINLGFSPSVKEESNDHGYNKSGRIWTIEWRDRKNGDNGSCRSWNVDNTLISRIYDISEAPSQDIVYDLTVDEDHTYMVENVTVSNCNEGFGLPTLEAMMCGKPIIAIKTGGLTRQVEHPETGEQFGIGLDPEVRTLVGNHMVPYIYEDFVSHATVTSAFMRMYEMGPEERERIGMRACERAREDYNLDRVISDWDSSLEKTIEKFKNGENKKWRVTEI